jgi:hypothetical protein
LYKELKRVIRRYYTLKKCILQYKEQKMELTKRMKDNIAEAIQFQKENIDELNSLAGEKQLKLAEKIVEKINPLLCDFSAYVGNSDGGDYFICLVYGKDDGSDWYLVSTHDLQVSGMHQIVLASDQKDYIFVSDYFSDLELFEIEDEEDKPNPEKIKEWERLDKLISKMQNYLMDLKITNLPKYHEEIEEIETFIEFKKEEQVKIETELKE